MKLSTAWSRTQGSCLRDEEAEAYRSDIIMWWFAWGYVAIE